MKLGTQLSKDYWALLRERRQSAPDNQLFESQANQRVEALMALLSVEAAISAYWKARVVEEWAELNQLINTILEDDSELERLRSLLNEDSSSNLISWMNVLLLVDNPETFLPDLVDVAILVTLLAHPSQQNLAADLAKTLLRLQKLRPHCLKPSNEFTPLMAKEVHKLCTEFRALGAEFHELLNEVYLHNNQQGAAKAA